MYFLTPHCYGYTYTYSPACVYVHLAMTRPIPNLPLELLSAADIYRSEVLFGRIRIAGPEWTALNDFYANRNLPQVEVYADGVYLGSRQGFQALAWRPNLTGWGVYFKRPALHHLNGGGPVSGRQSSDRAKLMVSTRRCRCKAKVRADRPPLVV